MRLAQPNQVGSWAAQRNDSNLVRPARHRWLDAPSTAESGSVWGSEPDSRHRRQWPGRL